EGVLPDDRLVALHVNTGDTRHLPARGPEALGVDAEFQAVVVVARPHRHDDFFEGAVAGPFTNAVDGALDLPGAFLDRGQTVGDGETEIVVAMNAQYDLVDAAHVLLEVADGGGVLLGDGVANGVGDVDRRRAGGDHLLDDFREKLQLGAGRVFGG